MGGDRQSREKEDGRGREKVCLICIRGWSPLIRAVLNKSGVSNILKLSRFSKKKKKSVAALSSHFLQVITLTLHQGVNERRGARSTRSSGDMMPRYRSNYPRRAECRALSDLRHAVAIPAVQ